jgi:hypothetical protein
MQAIEMMTSSQTLKLPQTQASSDPMSSIFAEIRKLKPDSDRRMKVLQKAESVRIRRL